MQKQFVNPDDWECFANEMVINKRRHETNEEFEARVREEIHEHNIEKGNVKMKPFDPNKPARTKQDHKSARFLGSLKGEGLK